jgi:hypothetical protein
MQKTLFNLLFLHIIYIPHDEPQQKNAEPKKNTELENVYEKFFLHDVFNFGIMCSPGESGYPCLLTRTHMPISAAYWYRCQEKQF